MYSVHCTPMCNVHRKWYSLTMNSQRSVFFQFCISKFIFYFILYTCHFFHFSYCCCGIPTNTNGAQSYLHKRDLVAQSVLTHRFLLQRVKVKKGPRYKMERKKMLQWNCIWRECWFQNLCAIRGMETRLWRQCISRNLFEVYLVFNAVY